jgi:A/G-specific adenine glycosylase
VAGTVVHVFTHFRLELTVFTAAVPATTMAPSGMWWSMPDDLPGEALPSVMKKAIEAALPGATRHRRRAA